MSQLFFTYDSKTKSLTINIFAKPSSKQNKISEIVEVETNGIYKSFIKIQIKAPPESGKANRELINFLSNYLEIPKSNIRIIFGSTSKYKIVSVINCTEKTITNIYKTIS